ncbi:MAG: hypothetical protein HYY06_15605 [Deltaproteobacteria bacterium]|nr:hypothetical protein [Deltaproteobacteria bacterium]
MGRFVAVAATLMALPFPAPAQTVDEAARAFSEARFDDSRAMFTAVAASSTASVPDLAEAHRYLTALDLLFDRPSSARAHADAAVALQPRVTAPEGAPEETNALFARASSARGGQAVELGIDLPPDPIAGAPVRARARIGGVPDMLSGPIELRCRGSGEATEATSSSGAVELAVATRGMRPGDGIRCEASARTPQGALLREGTRSVVLRALQDGRPRGAVATDRGGSGSTWIWIGAGAGAAVVATAVVVGLLASSGGGEITLGRPQVEGF